MTAIETDENINKNIQALEVLEQDDPVSPIALKPEPKLQRQSFFLFFLK